MTGAVPAHWRPAISTSGGRPVVTFRGRELRSIVAEFTDIEVMIAQAAADGVDHLLLSPWIMLVPTEAELAEAVRVCRVQNEGLSLAAAGGQVSALGAVPLQDAAAAVAELDYLMRLPGLRGAEVLGTKWRAVIWATSPSCRSGRPPGRPPGADLRASHHPRLRAARARGLLPVELGGQSAGDRHYRRAPGRRRGAGAVPAAAHPARPRRRRAAVELRGPFALLRASRKSQSATSTAGSSAQTGPASG